MANYLRYTYQLMHADSSLLVFDDVDDAKEVIDFGEYDFTGLSPEWTLENDRKMLVLKVPFTDAQAHVEMKAFHANLTSDTWNAKLADVGDLDRWDGHSEIVYSIDNKYVVGDTEI